MSAFARRPLAPACAGTFAVLAVCARAAEGSVPFPTEPAEIARHCVVVANGASAVGTHFTANPKAVPLAQAAGSIADEIVVTGAISRDELKRLNADSAQLQSDITAFLTAVGIARETRSPTNEALAEVGSHLAQCKEWLMRRPPEIAPLPEDAAAMLDHCVVVAVSAQSVGTSRAGAQAARLASNGRDMLGEMQQTGIVKPQTLRPRLQGPEGDLYLQGLEMAMKLKIARPGPGGLDARSLRMLDERIGKCHKVLGLQMPLQ